MNSKKLKILVTGSQGFIGRNLLKYLKTTGYEVYGIDKVNRYGKDENEVIDSLFNVVRYYDIQPDIVVHLAAETNTYKEGREVFTDNVLGSSIIKNVFPKSKIIYTSSYAVYGNSHPNIKPLNDYGKTKYEGEKFFDLDRDVILRLVNVYGENYQRHKGKMRAYLDQMLEQSLEGRVKLYEGSENYSRDWLNVDELVKLIEKLFYVEEGGVYDVGSGRSYKFGEIVEIMKKYKDFKVEYIGEPPKFYQTFSLALLNYDKLPYKPRDILEDYIRRFYEM